MEWVAWVVLVWIALDTLIGPFMIGKKVDYIATGYILASLFRILVAVLVGRILGWW